METFDIATCSYGPILRVDVETQTTNIVNLVDEQCGTVDLILQLDVTTNTWAHPVQSSSNKHGGRYFLL